MNSSVTTRMPGLAIRTEGSQTLVAPVATSVVERAVSDETLMLQVRTGSREALAVLFRRYARIVRGVAYKVLRDSSEADELVQDVFLLVQRYAAKFDGSRGPARSWILQIAYRRAISRRHYLTSRHFYTRLDLGEVARELIDPHTNLDQRDGSLDEEFGNRALHRVFDELSENQRQTLCLFFLEGYTFDEIAVKLGQSRGNVKHHYFRGLERFRKELFGDKSSGERTGNSTIKGLVRRKSGGVVRNRTP